MRITNKVCKEEIQVGCYYQSPLTENEVVWLIVEVVRSGVFNAVAYNPMVKDKPVFIDGITGGLIPFKGTIEYGNVKIEVK